jgi:hypothetical protein
MKRIWWAWLLGAVLLSTGCSLGARRLEDTAGEVNEKAFGGTISCRVVFCSGYDSTVPHTGLFDWEANIIHIKDGWLWEPDMFLKGIVAHEMIHAYLYNCSKMLPGDPHTAAFLEERRRVAGVLKIPVWAIPNGTTIDRLQITESLRDLDATMDRMEGR